MSTLKVAAINNPSASSGGLAISTAGNVTGGGLDLITSQSFTAASAVNVNNCFSSTYENYRVVVNLTGATAGALNMRLRNAGADLTTSTYSRFGVDAGATAPAASNLAAQSAFLLAGSLGSNRWSGHIEFFKSQESAVKSFVATAVIESGYGVLYGGFNSTATAHDGFSIYPASGTITGLIRVYGYRN